MSLCARNEHVGREQSSINVALAKLWTRQVYALGTESFWDGHIRKNSMGHMVRLVSNECRTLCDFGIACFLEHQISNSVFLCPAGFSLGRLSNPDFEGPPPERPQQQQILFQHMASWEPDGATWWCHLLSTTWVRLGTH